MGGNKFLKRSLAMILAATTIFTQSNITGYGLTDVEAAEAEDVWIATNYVTNGDFETGTNTGWTISENDAITTAVKTDSWATNNTTNFLNIYTTTDASEFSMSQEVTLPAGTYYVSSDLEGIAHDAIFTLSLGDKTTKSLSATTGWNIWATDKTDSFTLDTQETLTLSISATLTPLVDSEGKLQAWFDLDNIIIYQQASYDLEDLTTLAASVPEDHATLGFTASSEAALTTALTTANALIEATAGEAVDRLDIVNAYLALETAISNLVLDGDVFITKIAGYDSDSIRGVDVSSYVSLMNAFDAINENITDESKKVGFRGWDGTLLSRQGFFDLLAASGVNYVRLRVWNDPYDTAGKGYGGGNNTIAQAIEMGKYTTNAGMKVLIDFHFSDFWADPGKQKAPKAWADYTVAQKAEAISTYVTESLTTLVTENGIAVEMVQIGNETTGSICGENNWDNMNILFDAGCDAVHAFNDTNSTNILAALHFTNPERSGRYATIGANLAGYDSDGDGTADGVSYDVFASSYYPYWHGTLSNLTSVLANIASTYDKYVMVAETSWATTLADGDGHENTINDAGDLGSDAAYSTTIQGQVNEFRDVINAVNNIDITLKNGDKAGIGVFYWEPAWIPVQYAYNEDGTVNNDIVDSNKTYWEEYGCGWASGYAAEYDPADAGVWHGGSAVDNQAVFDFNGNPLASLSVFNANSLIYGSATDVAVETYTCSDVEATVGGALTLPSTVTIKYNDSTTATDTVAWDATEVQALEDAMKTVAGLGTHTIHGTLVTNAGYQVECTVTVLPANLLTNGGFEAENGGEWVLTGSGYDFGSSEDPRSGSKGLHFYSGSAFEFTATQTITVTQAGYYNAQAYLQGLASCGNGTDERIYLEVIADGQSITSADTALGGWVEWVKPEVTNIQVTPAMIEAGNNTLTFVLHVKANAGAWGSIDDVSLYFDKAVDITFADETATLAAGTTKQLTATPNYTGADIKWTSSNTAVATVSSTGLVTAVAPGTATITASDFGISATCTVTVTKADISTTAITLASGSYTYDGTAKTPAVTVAYNGKNLTANTDYTVTYANNTNAGTATVTITGKGIYTGTAAKTFTIAKASKQITTKASSYTKKYGNAAFSLNAKVSGAGSLTYTLSNKNVVKVASNGRVTIIGCGKVTVTVSSKATSNYNAAAAKKITITVTPKNAKISSLKSTKAAKMTVKWAKDAKASGYVISYSTNKNFKNAKTVTVNSNKTVVKTISKLAKGKTYYVRVRSFKTSGKTKIYGSYSSVKKVKIKK